MNREQKKQWMIEQLAPYLADPSTCGYENYNCVYKTSDGRMCVAGKNMNEKFLDTGDSISNLIFIHGPKKVFNNHPANKITRWEWQELQLIHDSIAEGKEYEIIRYINRLGYFTWEELQEAADKIRNKTNYEQ